MSIVAENPHNAITNGLQFGYSLVTIRLKFGNKKSAEEKSSADDFLRNVSHSDSSLYLAGAQASGAGVYSAGSAVYDSLYLLYVGLVGSVGASV